MAVRLVLLLFFIVVLSSTVGQTNITAEPGENATLPCRTKNNQPAVVVEWRRNDTGVVKDVALYRDGRFDIDGQHPLYHNRVNLQDREMKDGDVSLVLMNVTTDHTGIYECRVYQKGNKRRKRSELKVDPICIISLDVAPPFPSGHKEGLKEDGGNKDGGNKDGGNKDGGNKDGENKDGGNKDGLIAGLVVVIVGVIVGFIVVVLASVGGFLLYRKRRQSFKDQNRPARDMERDPINTEKPPIS